MTFGVKKALTFCATRCILYGWGLWRFFTEDPNIFTDVSVWQATPVVFAMGYILNLFWMAKILSMRDRSKKSI